MFGEPESPRVGSPWDSLLSPSSSPLPRSGSISPTNRDVTGELYPKLIPEVEEGNVEYKLKLTDPSPERFLRLVTQLKWRLLEGGGQAYYELGVADSGQLVGLTRADLDRSLETLEMMAGEIGASVIIVKEIEVPARLVSLAAKAGGVSHLAFRMKGRRATRHALTGDEDDDSSSFTPRINSLFEETEGEETEVTITTEAETTTDADDDDRPAIHVLGTASTFPHLCSHPDRPTAQSSPTLLPQDGTTEDLTFDLEISSVFKPLPSRRRDASKFATELDGDNGRRYTKKGTPPNKAKNKKEKDKDVSSGDKSNIPLESKGRKARERRARRDANRNAVRKEEAEAPFSSLSSDYPVAIPEHTNLAPSRSAPVSIPSTISSNNPSPSTPSPSPNIQTSLSCDSLAEPRLIVEALVVRKVSMEDAFLDFGNFNLGGS